MKKVVIHKAGGFNRLLIERSASPSPGRNEVKIKVYAIGINYADIVVRWGLYRSAKQFAGWPITPGFEISGVVEAIGEGANKFQIGQKVFGLTLFNGYSTEICIPEHQVFALPVNLTMEEAAAFLAVFLTAYHAVFQNIIIRKGVKVIVHSAAGGVGSALLQLCHILQAETIGVVGSSHKIEAAREFGAVHVLDKSAIDLWHEIEKIFPEGADVIFDANGGKSLRNGFEHLAKGGKMVTYGTHSIMPRKRGNVNWVKLIYSILTAPKFHSLKLNTRSIINFNLSFMFDRKDLLEEAMNDLLGWLENGDIQPLGTTSFRFEDVAEAHRALQSGKTTGKLVLITE